VKREAEQFGLRVCELVQELFDEGVTMAPANEFFVTLHRDRVVSIRLFLRPPGADGVAPMNISTQQAVELAAWLVAAAGLGEHMTHEEARTYFDRAFQEILET
jgi:hypothetical protein